MKKLFINAEVQKEIKIVFYIWNVLLISQRLLNNTCDFISKYLENINYNKHDDNINNIIRILIYTSHHFEIKKRQKIIFKKYNGSE